jgi:hypothetical protein
LLAWGREGKRGRRHLLEKEGMHARKSEEKWGRHVKIIQVLYYGCCYLHEEGEEMAAAWEKK